MNIKRAKNLQISTTESKKTNSANSEREQNHTYRDHWDGGQWGGGLGE